jgi:ribonuclease R/exosome complex exonuclease DIS3/RRP44
MIRAMDMREDFFHFDFERHALIGERTKKTYQLGDPIKIRVKKVDLLKRFLDFTPIV